MKTHKLFFSFVLVFISVSSIFAQIVKKETIKVNGECGMCKKKIEKAAKANGAALANWNADTKILQVSYNPKKTSSGKIQKAIAAVGYDTEKYAATDDAYDQLDECCKYDRKGVSATAKAGDEKKCCDMEKCGKEKDACKDMTCCKDKEMKCCKHEDHKN